MADNARLKVVACLLVRSLFWIISRKKRVWILSNLFWFGVNFLFYQRVHQNLFKFSIFLLGNRLQSNLGLQSNLSLRTPLYYGQFVWSQKCQKSYISYLYNTDTSARWTLGSVPLVSVLKRFDCMWKATKLQSLLSWYVVFPPLFLKKG